MLGWPLIEVLRIRAMRNVVCCYAARRAVLRSGHPSPAHYRPIVIAGTPAVRPIAGWSAGRRARIGWGTTRRQGSNSVASSNLH